ncbi:MAG: glycogen debranching N-terminal domain-containing protein, partial [Candidatus Limnocylindrales bacterium]
MATVAEKTTVRFLPARVVPIAHATDLGSVQVLKHGNRFLLTDAFGDIVADSRGLGLYHGDTRILACSVLRVDGERPVLLQASVGGNYRGGIQMTNPAEDRNPDMKVHTHTQDDLVGRTVRIGRERVFGNEGFEERVRIVNHAERRAHVPIELDFGADGADIFEVRGYPRTGRGRLLPVAIGDQRVTFRFDGLDGIQQLTHIAFTEAALDVQSVVGVVSDGADTGAAVRLRWHLELAPGEVRELSWTVWCTD